ncbi:hypothetical protein MNBD_NITROSPINAE03-572 [hydrothermal vent metagenome]|uniref:Lipoprotein n=1 Tax=hydrothermal vent metagenome TaxID=652676 RepID=A0A3B1CEV1_9ZZZZ
MTRFYGIAFLLSAIILSGCATGAAGSKYYLFSDPLDKEVAAWSQSAKLYHQFDTKFIVDVIYNSEQLRQAWIKKTSELSKLSSGEIKRLTDQQNSENERYAQFFVALYTPDEEWNNMAGKKSKWSVFLESDSGPVRPESITEVDAESLPWSANLPFDPNFRTVYRINFPRDESGFGVLKLHISSLLGEVRLTWNTGQANSPK